jgi:hypothetical protein
MRVGPADQDLAPVVDATSVPGSGRPAPSSPRFTVPYSWVVTWEQASVRP